jgi:hypothetical protein
VVDNVLTHPMKVTATLNSTRQLQGGVHPYVVAQ